MIKQPNYLLILFGEEGQRVGKRGVVSVSGEMFHFIKTRINLNMKYLTKQGREYIFYWKRLSNGSELGLVSSGKGLFLEGGKLRFSRNFVISNLQRMKSESYGSVFLRKLIQCLVHSRCCPQKCQSFKIDYFIRQIHKHRHQETLSSFFKIMDQLSPPRESINHQAFTISPSHPTALLCFGLQSDNLQAICAQTWEIQIMQKNEPDQLQAKKLFISVVEQLLGFMRGLPLYCDFLANHEYKSRYKITYQLNSWNCQNHYKSIYHGFPSFPQFYLLQRTSSNLIITIACYSYLKLDQIISSLSHSLTSTQANTSCSLSTPRKYLPPEHKLTKMNPKPTEDQEEFIQLNPYESKRHSMFEQYDPNTDCTFLSNCKQSFEEQPLPSLHKIQLNLVEEEEQFQILQIPELKFIQQNKELFQDLDREVSGYFGEE